MNKHYTMSLHYNQHQSLFVSHNLHGFCFRKIIFKIRKQNGNKNDINICHTNSYEYEITIISYEKCFREGCLETSYQDPLPRMTRGFCQINIKLSHCQIITSFLITVSSNYHVIFVRF